MNDSRPRRQPARPRPHWHPVGITRPTTPALARPDGAVEPDPQARPVRRASALRDTVIVSSGTLVSRILGFVRLMVALYVLTKVVNDVFQLANTLPNQVYDLFISSAFSAVLIPTIVRAKRSQLRDQTVTALFFVGFLGLAAVTLIATLAAPVLVTIMGVKLPANWWVVAVGMAYWCLPQIFFYGMHSLLGQYLNAYGRFIAFAWSPVLNNIVAIGGLLFFNHLYGQTRELSDPAVWDAATIAALAGPATLGIVLQALVLIWPVWACGFRPVFPIRVRGLGLGKALRDGIWAVFIVAANYIRIWAITNVAVAALSWAQGSGIQVPSITENAAASLFYALPFSVLIVSVMNVIFPRIVEALTEADYPRVHSLILGFHRYVGPIALFCTIALATGALPLAQALTILSDYDPYLVAIAIVATATKLIPASTSLMNQRILFAEGKARSVLLCEIPASLVTLAGAFLGVSLAAPRYWLAAAICADAAGFWLVTFLMRAAISAPVRADLGQILGHYLRPVVGAGAAGAAGLGYLSLIGFYSANFATLVGRGLSLVAIEAIVFVVVGLSGPTRSELLRLVTKRRL